MKKILILIMIFAYTLTILPQPASPEGIAGITAIAAKVEEGDNKKSENADTKIDEDSDDDSAKKDSKSKKSSSEQKSDSKKTPSKTSSDDDDNKKAGKTDKEKDEKSENSKKSDSKKSDKKKDDDEEKVVEEEYVIHAGKYLAYDLSYNTTLISKDSGKKLDPSGLTKILTAITAIESVSDVNKKVVVPEGILEDYDYYYANVGLASGDEISYKNLLKLMMMRDAGDCAVALSHLCLDSYNEFIKAMNSVAKKAGAKNSYFDNPAGFESSKNYSTLDDLCLIIKYALGNEIFCEVASCSTLEIPSSDPDGKPRRYFNKNYYMSTFYSLNYFNENIRHGKEYTINKENTGLFVNYNNGFTNLICICAESDADDETNYAYEDINSLVKSAKSDFTTVSIVQKDEIITEVPLRNGADADRVLLVSDESIRTKLENGYDPLKIHKKIILNDKIKAPVKKGEQLGAVTVTYNGSTLGQSALVAFSDVDSSVIKHFMYYFDSVINSAGFKTILILTLALIVGLWYIKHKKKRKENN